MNFKNRETGEEIAREQVKDLWNKGEIKTLPLNFGDINLFNQQICFYMTLKNGCAWLLATSKATVKRSLEMCMNPKTSEVQRTRELYDIARWDMIPQAMIGFFGNEKLPKELEDWNPTIYYDDVNRPTSLKSRGLLLYANSSTLKGFNTLGEEVWTNRDSEYKHNNLTFTDDTSVNGNPSLVFGGLWKQNYNRGTATPNYTQLTHGHRGGHNKRPSNWLLLCNTDKFNKIHVRLENLFNGLPAGSISYSDLIYENVKVNISMWYVAQTASYSSAVEWKPLSFVDGTSTGGNAESLRKSGTLYFDIPDDWEKKKASNIAQWDGTTGNPVPEQDGTTLNEDPISLWTEDMYSILIGISVDGGQRALDNDWQYKIQCPYIQTYNNSHSRAITIKDPHHKSLNDITIAQNISWNRSGKIMQLADRFGRS